MPTYEYQCEACEHQFEEFQSITAKPLRKCPSCSKPKLKRLIGTGAGVIFKGSGFYETDYRSEGYQKSAKAESESAKPNDESKAKTDSKTAKPETKASETKTDKPKKTAKQSSKD
ncbi:FmdB family zinc ribbon protein [Mucisphaera sp.]|uniref:FmdB family zinc ribbon protein n=1 Tax=Mucisphaera sp. TaxID=2913024 RepID=UPI003D0C8640